MSLLDKIRRKRDRDRGYTDDEKTARIAEQARINEFKEAVATPSEERLGELKKQWDAEQKTLKQTFDFFDRILDGEETVVLIREEKPMEATTEQTEPSPKS